MKVVLYSTNCPKCQVLEKKLKNSNIEFELIQDVEAMIKKGFKSVPMLDVDDMTMDFTQAINWINEQE